MPEEASASVRPAIVIPPALEPLAAKKRCVVWKLWSESGKDHSAEYHFGTQSIDEIARLPVAPLAADDCALLLWCTWSHIAIGSHFRPCPAAFNWVKTNADGSLFGGMGYYTRSGGEAYLFATNVHACLTAQPALFGSPGPGGGVCGGVQLQGTTPTQVLLVRTESASPMKTVFDSPSVTSATRVRELR